MTVAKFVQPNYTTQSAAVYKAAIDAAIAVLATVGGDYACHAKDTPDMQVLVDAGQLFTTGSTLVSNTQQTSATITAPVTNPRIDRIVINDQTGVVAVVTGSEAASPTAPTITVGTRPIAQILLQTSSTVISNSMITDERVVETYAFSTFIRTLLDDADAAAARATLGAVGLTGNETIAGQKTLSDLLTLTAGQIKFPDTQNPSADANTLDDYEEGTWTPDVGGTATYLAQSGQYVKVGSLVIFSWRLQINAIGTGSVYIVSGLPFTAGGAAAEIYESLVQVNSGGATSVVSSAGTIPGTATSISIRSRTAAAVSDLNNAIFTASTRVYGAGHYYV
jgi:hypothetical protein